MVDIDLRKLSAPIEALRPALQKAYERLDAKWGEIIECLHNLPIPCSVSYTYKQSAIGNSDFDCLVWKKWNGKKRLCIEHNSFTPEHPDYDWKSTITPYEEWSGEQRIAMLQHVPGLFTAAEEATKRFIENAER